MICTIITFNPILVKTLIFTFFSNRWNLIDFITNSLYITTVVLKLISYVIVQTEMRNNKDTYKLNRENWDPWDPTLIRYACQF